VTLKTLRALAMALDVRPGALVDGERPDRDPRPMSRSIGKMTRYLDPDVGDIVEVFRRQSVIASRATRTWGRALRASPASTTQFQFRRRVESFLQQRGRSIWGVQFDAPAAIATFQKAAGI